MNPRIAVCLMIVALGPAAACDGGPTDSSAPGAPTGLAAAPHNGRVSISWSAVAGVDRYHLYWATAPGVTKASGTRHGDVTSPFDHTALANGTTYYYVVTAENAGGESGASAEVSAAPANAAPTASAGADQTAATGATVTLNGTGSDADGDAISYAWTQTSGAAVSLTNPATAQPTFRTPHRLGQLQFSLAVSDGTATSPPDAVSVTIDRFTLLTVASDLAAANSDTETPGKLAALRVGPNVLVVSCRLMGSPAGLFGTVLDGSSGQVLQTVPISAHNCVFPRPAVASSGNGFLVVFQRAGELVATRLSATYSVVGEAVISTGTSNWAPAVAFDGTAFLVVWAKFTSTYDIYGARIATTGQSSGESPVFVQTGEQLEPAIAFDGANYLVIWRDTRSGSGPAADTDIYGTRVAPNGTVLDPAGIAISTAASYQGEPQLAFDGANYLAVWSDARRYPVQAQPPLDVFGTRISPAGALLDGTSPAGGIAICTADVSASVTLYPTVAFDGTNYLVVFAVVGFFPPAGIYHGRVTTGGMLLDRQASVLGPSISGTPQAFSRLVYPAVVSSGQRAFLVWVDNIEVAGAAKDIVGVIMDP